MKKILLSIVPLFALFSSLFFIQNFSNLQDNKSEQNLSENSERIVSPTPMPFAEMTIPSLRLRNYSSNLGTTEQISNNGTYSSFLSSYKSDNLKINALLTKPTSPDMPVKGWPAIIFIHGYIPPTEYRTTEKYIAYVDSLARSGFVVFKIDLRGHGLSEGEASGAYYSSDYIVDVLTAYDALSNLDFVDEENIGLWGHSMAGNIVMRTLAVKPTIKASVIWAGAVYTYEDMQEYGLDDTSYRPPPVSTQRQGRRQMLLNTHGNFDKNNPFWNNFTAMNYLKDIKGNLAFHHALDDKVVSMSYTRNLLPYLKSAGVNYESHEYLSGGHNIDSPSFEIAMSRTVDFYKKHLSNN